ncbi:DUF2304 domain-containing protein [Pseudonocardia bannensis]|uniref:DUF2304 domain-containing protein n=1 Tax=Pseudonocardia bannensis TaxID=630973 RepID=A0A848DB91_9PSEU|nr:DUF2304 domain-containing protein [Pseudonocardia bannensis]NMH90142.1 DUF2304 domain-containing protein [Pseudonocardia bannensis]
MARLTIFSLVIAVGVLLLVAELLRRRRLREKYAVIWVLFALGTLTVAVFPSLLNVTARFVGIETPSNLLFLVSLLALLTVSLQLSGEVGLLEEQTRRLAEEVGALRMKIDDVPTRRDKSVPCEEESGSETSG